MPLALLALATASQSCATGMLQGVFWRGDRTPTMVPDPWQGIHIYGGTALDLGIWGWITGIKEHVPDAQDGAWTMLLLDLPFAIVADTVLLPLTICEQVGVFGTPGSDT